MVDGLPRFLDQLVSMLSAQKDARGSGHRNISAGATPSGGELSQVGLTVGQVVRDCGSICHSVRELADERELAITADELHAFNRCLDEATAQAVTEYEHQRDQALSGEGVAHLGFLAHEMRNLLTTSMLSFDALGRGTVGVKGSMGALLGRSLQRMRALVERTLAEVRLGAGAARPTRVSVAELLEEIEIIATIEANDRDIQLSVEPGARDVAVEGDPQILASVVANLVQNALKFTHPRGHIVVRAHATGERVLIDVEDECGGLPPGNAQDLFRPFEQRGVDQTGLGLGLSISMKGVQASGGDLYVRDRPGSGCMFTVDLPRAL